ncbi:MULTISPECIES: hypothetical protein [Wolbachia]|uniref:hypothetical protein n=1 Tax=Wolbachia TaxID=953 RepID=UPI0015FC5471|nr:MULTISPECIES: hypothetical protein [Wolbachia]MBA8757465.1 hypothetical protein [Wolbachia pipientis]MDE5059336.1 hypothetical protein [Wolbachia endosymbiont of Drosophila baimaii]
MQQSPLESSLYYAATWLELSLLDPSSQATRMTGEGGCLDDGRRGYLDPGGCNYCA